MESRIPASERTSQKLNKLLIEGVTDGGARPERLKLTVQNIVGEALEAEVSGLPGRGDYENGAETGRCYRNGYRHDRLHTAEAATEYGVPQVSDRAEPFRRASAPGSPAARSSSSASPWRCSRAGCSRESRPPSGM